MFEKIYGVNINLKFKSSIVLDEAIIGLVDASRFKDFIEREELFAFNIRKFLGLRKGSVNWQINQSLEDEEKRKDFWMLNNGIVCLCTDFSQGNSDGTYNFQNFTVVNGAQTITTIAKFLERNPVIDEPIWVLAKVIKVREDDIERAFRLTKTSNTQTPTNTKDLRAVDISHRRLQKWFKQYFDIEYIYRRGEKAHSQSHIKMKEMAQAFVAYWMRQPHVAFSRPGKIFADSEYYDEIFPAEDIEALKNHGDDASIREFLMRRLFPYLLLVHIREYITRRIQEGDEKKWRSLSYHIVWVYSEIFETIGVKEDMGLLLGKH
ncbi:AIPR family protein [Thermococcus sp.]|uniref:AIPR family protein n=1 Tax=Thermococcus sp. TaxID=35749 RepID=UPI0025E18FD3|nr:AIPR family protein [Thermococcus sp.]